MFGNCNENRSHGLSPWTKSYKMRVLYECKKNDIEINSAQKRNVKCFHLDSMTDIDCDDAEI